MINFFKLAALAKATPKSKSEPALGSSPDQLAQERMSRRAALRRIGMAGGMTVLGVLSIDDLARVATQKLGEHEMTRGLAADFKAAGIGFQGVAFADGYMPPTVDVDTGLKPPTPEKVIDIYTKCLQQNADPKLAWPCLAKGVGADVFDKNFEYVWCTAITNGGTQNAEMCPGFPQVGVCDKTNPVKFVCESCGEAKNAKCIAKGGPQSVEKCNDDLVIWEINNC